MKSRCSRVKEYSTWSDNHNDYAVETHKRIQHHHRQYHPRGLSSFSVHHSITSQRTSHNHHELVTSHYHYDSKRKSMKRQYSNHDDWNSYDRNYCNDSRCDNEDDWYYSKRLRSDSFDSQTTRPSHTIAKRLDDDREDTNKQFDRAPVKYRLSKDSSQIHKRLERCRYYTMGQCKKSEKECNYMHSDYPCTYYHTLNYCTKGSRCRFSHEPIRDPQLKAVFKEHLRKRDEVMSQRKRAKENNTSASERYDDMDDNEPYRSSTSRPLAIANKDNSPGLTIRVDLNSPTRSCPSSPDHGISHNYEDLKQQLIVHVLKALSDKTNRYVQIQHETLIELLSKLLSKNSNEEQLSLEALVALNNMFDSIACGSLPGELNATSNASTSLKVQVSNQKSKRSVHTSPSSLSSSNSSLSYSSTSSLTSLSSLTPTKCESTQYKLVELDQKPCKLSPQTTTLHSLTGVPDPRLKYYSLSHVSQQQSNASDARSDWLPDSTTNSTTTMANNKTKPLLNLNFNSVFQNSIANSLRSLFTDMQQNIKNSNSISDLSKEEKISLMTFHEIFRKNYQ